MILLIRNLRIEYMNYFRLQWLTKRVRVFLQMLKIQGFDNVKYKQKIISHIISNNNVVNNKT